jgi:hypothetical protein
LEQSGHPGVARECPLLGVKRTLLLTGDKANIAQLAELLRIQAAAKPSREASSWDILTLVSRARRCWYSVMHADEQNRMCQ